MSRFTTRSRALIGLLIGAVAAVLAIALLPASASAYRPSPAPAVPPPPAMPTNADQIQNLGQVETAIKGYYGDTVSGTNPDGTPQHLPSPTGAYAHQMAGIVANAERYLAWAAHRGRNGHTRPAIVLDVDDTTLNTYNYEIDTQFAYTPASNAVFVDAEAFPAVFHMVDLVKFARHEGYSVFYLTGRPASQRTPTEGNLAKVGYPAVPDSQVYLKDQTKPWLASCAPDCTTIQFKSLTRRHIESLGYTIVGNFGDQYSDLEGGYAWHDVKLPNPMYYLP